MRHVDFVVISIGDTILILFPDASLEWETFEQYCLWQLIAAHNIPVDYILPILPKLEFTGMLFQQIILIFHHYLFLVFQRAVNFTVPKQSSV